MPIPADFEPVILALLKATQEGRVHWLETASPDAFSVSFKNKTVQLSIKRYERSSPDYVIALYSETGKFMVDCRGDPNNDPAYEPLKDLYNLALRKARQIDKTINDLLTEIQEGKTIGEDIPF